MLHAMIMAGGGGTRFWPRSRRDRPKQFLTLTGERTLLQQAVERVEGLVPPERTWVITAHEHVAETGRQLADRVGWHIVGEPLGRDTAACIALGAALVARVDPDAVLLVTPADHVIEPAQRFRQAVQVAVQLVAEHPGALVTFGVPPTFPATGYGYIERGAEVPGRQGLHVFRVQSFREKPDAETAERLLATGRYYWNSGLFVWRAATILRELRDQQPALATAIERIADAWGDADRDEVFRREYEPLAKLSIDYAVLEHAAEALVIQAPFSWDDVGSWLALERLHPQDADHNTVLAQHEGVATERCVIVGDGGHLIATVGVRDLLIVQDGAAILVAHRDCEGDVKKLVEQLRQRGREDYL